MVWRYLGSVIHAATPLLPNMPPELANLCLYANTDWHYMVNAGAAVIGLTLVSSSIQVAWCQH